MIYSLQGGPSIARNYYKYSKAIMAAYPTLPFKPSEFIYGMYHFSYFCVLTLIYIERVRWQGPASTLVHFFNRLAHSKGFHPTKEWERWYTVSTHDVHEHKGRRVFDVYGGLFKAVSVAYPTIPFERSQFGM